jgi:simple sugar transport system permease protein
MTDLVTPFLEATIRTATPLAIAAVGETVAERAGIINVGLEGALIAGCLGAVAGAATGGVVAGLSAGVAAGLIVAIIFGCFVIELGTDQIITGTALTVGAYGATGVLYREGFGPAGAALGIPVLQGISLPGLASIPWLGPILFQQPVVTYLLYALVPLVSWWLYRTSSGLSLRATGEYPPAVVAAGAPLRRLRWIGVVASCSCGGLAGATLAMQVGTFSEQMSAGRGFIVLAIVALGRWTPFGALAAALLFGGASALQYRFQASGAEIPYQLFLALPYLVTLLVLAGGLGRARAPAGLGRPVNEPR